MLKVEKKESQTFGPFKALIFDQDGTLLDAEAMHCEAWIYVASENGVNFDEKIFASFAGKGDHKIAEYIKAQANMDKSNDQLVEEKRNYYKKHLDSLKLMPGVKQFLKEAKSTGIKMAMATISPAEETLKTVRKYGLDQYLTQIVHCESQVPGREGEVVRKKPEPDIYLAAAHLLGVNPTNCCAFEDSLTGVEAAKTAGMTCIAIPTQFSKHFDYSKADVVINNLDQVSIDNKLEINISE